jgi:hypothetical protein
MKSLFKVYLISASLFTTMASLSIPKFYPYFSLAILFFICTYFMLSNPKLKKALAIVFVVLAVISYLIGLNYSSNDVLNETGKFFMYMLIPLVFGVILFVYFNEVKFKNNNTE